MTMTADFTDTSRKATVSSVAAMPLRIADTGHMIIRGAQRVAGAALVIAALGLWLVPGSSMESDVVLLKLILTLTAALAGLGLMQASVVQSEMQVEVDTIRREVRMVRRQRNATGTVVQTAPFSELGGAEIDGAMIRIWDQSGLLLAEVAPLERKAFSSLVAGLRDEGKLI
jgi:hypothetical protein